jgi:3-hydroxymyristoyl/3-hydroxydecanoyl-(acyl carrier protein) dehydratase
MSEQTLALSVAADHPAYAGHFPGRPILPGVVLLDEAILALAGQHGLDAASGQIKAAKFLSPVNPGEPLRLHFTETAAGVFRFEVLAGERIAASGVFAFAATSAPGGAA